MAPRVGHRLLRQAVDPGRDRGRNAVDVADQLDVDEGSTAAIEVLELFEVGDAWAGCQLRRIVPAQNPDHAAHLGERA